MIRGGGEVGSAIAYRLARCHFRVCMTELASPQAISRGVSFSEAIYDTTKMVEELTAERALLSNWKTIYRIWRSGKIPIVADPESAVKPLIKPDVLINAMMLNRETNTRLTDAPSGYRDRPGFYPGSDVHVVIETNPGHNFGNIISRGKRKKLSIDPETTERRDHRGGRCRSIHYRKKYRRSGHGREIIGSLNDVPLKAPRSGVLHGILRSESKVLANIKLAEIDPTE